MPKGEVLITDFSTYAPASRVDAFVTGSHVGTSAAPAFTATTVDPIQYLSIKTGHAETFSLAPTRAVSVYIGSLDSYNALSFGSGASATSFTGAQLGAISGADNGNQTAGDTNGRFVFKFSQPVDSVTFASRGNSLEVASVAAGVPEPGSWALALIGLAGLGATLRRRRDVAAVAAA